MWMSDWRIGRPSVFLISCTILLSYSSELLSAAVVTLDSIEIFKTHYWIPTAPTIYFQCKEENEIILPDVKEKNTLYTFKGEESWQPLTELKDINCKHCGLYQKDSIKSSDVFDEWEFCASDFTRSDGRYVHFIDREFNATFRCLECVPLGNASDFSFNLKQYLRWVLIPVICIVVGFVVIACIVAACKCWQKRKRQQQQAKFLELFEESDDIEDELGIGPLSYSI